jgi:hypothetical protein
MTRASRNRLWPIFIITAIRAPEVIDRDCCHYFAAMTDSCGSKGSLLSKALRVFDQLRRNRQIAGIEAVNPIDAGAGILTLPCDRTSRMQIAVWRRR